MKILCLFLNNELRTGGQRRYLELMEDLVKKGNEVMAVINEDLDYAFSKIREIRVNCPYRHEDSYPKSFLFAKAVRKLSPAVLDKIKENDVIMIHGETHLKTAAWLRKKLGIPVLYGHRSNDVRALAISLREPSGFQKKFLTLYRLLISRFYENMIARKTDSIVFQSPYDRNDFCLRNKSAKDKAVIIRGNIGEPRFKKKWENSNQSIKLQRILFLGALGERKGIKYLIEAMCLLNNLGMNSIELDVLAPGDRSPYLSMIRENGMEKKIRFHGRVNNPFEYLAQCDLMVVPSIFDSYPDTVLEALHTGIPVIGSRAGGIPDMLKFDELLFPIQNSKAIADSLKEMYHDNKYYLHIRQLCKKRQSCFHFDWTGKWDLALRNIVS